MPDGKGCSHLAAHDCANSTEVKFAPNGGHSRRQPARGSTVAGARRSFKGWRTGQRRDPAVGVSGSARAWLPDLGPNQGPTD